MYFITNPIPKRLGFIFTENNTIAGVRLHVRTEKWGDFQKICGDQDLHAYTIKDVEHFKLKRFETCSPVTVNIAFRALRSVFNHAVKMQLLDENPFQKS